jgi:hypothetical protein
MRLFAAVAALLAVASCSATALAQEEKTYNQPIWFDDWLDWCLKWNADCGKPAADNFCNRKRYTGASGFAAELARGWRGSVCAGLSEMALVMLTSLLPTGFASADDCHVTESGIPKNVIAPVDVAGIRKSLATDGIALGGSYLAESFGNRGGINQGVTYDGLLTLYLNVDFYTHGGITFTDMIPRRPDDALAIGFAYTGVSNQVHGFDLDSGFPVARTYEALLEICYTTQLKPGWTLQPDFQYFWQPGGNVPDPSGKGAVANAAVVGARTTINFKISESASGTKRTHRLMHNEVSF